MRTLLAFLLLLVAATAGEARPRQIVAHPDCNRLFLCEGVISSPRGDAVVRAMGGFGTAVKIYKPRAEIVPHPAGCPARAFCGCGAALRVFGHHVRELWLAANWFRYPRAAPASGMVAVRRHHVFVLEADLGGGMWRVYDANSGGGGTRIHARSIAGYVIVNPRA